MVKYTRRREAEFTALIEETRFDIVDRLVESGPLSAGTIAEKYDMSFPAVSKHLRVLETARLVSSKKHGRNNVYHANKKVLSGMKEWVENTELFWEKNLESLKQFVENKK